LQKSKPIEESNELSEIQSNHQDYSFSQDLVKEQFNSTVVKANKG